MAKTLKEQMSLVPPVGGVGSPITPSQSSTLSTGNKVSQTNALTQNLVKQINSVTAAKKVNQQQLLKLVDQLKQSIAQDESNEEEDDQDLANEGIKPSTIGRVGGKIAGSLAGGALGTLTDPVTGPVGTIAGGAIGGEVGANVGEKIANAIAPDQENEEDADDEDSEEKSKKNKRRKLNNKKDTFMAKNKTNVQEGLGGGILGGIAGAMIPGAPILGAIGGSALGSKIEDKALSQNEQTSEQGHAVHALIENGFRVTHTKHEDHGDVIVLTKKIDKSTTKTAEVEPDGTVSGRSVSEFLGHDQDEQMVKAPLMHKEAATTINFLKAVSQKNYAQADKYLGSLVNEKLKRIISKASK